MSPLYGILCFFLFEDVEVLTNGEEEAGMTVLKKDFVPDLNGDCLQTLAFPTLKQKWQF